MAEDEEGGSAGSGREAFRRPGLVLFDVNETLSDLSVLGERFADVGAPRHLVTTWFAGLLRDGFALAAAGTSAPFAEIGAGLLRVQLASLSLDRDLDEAVNHVMAGFTNLALHPDVAPGIAALADLGLRLVTLSNGATSVAADQLDRAGITGQFEQLLSVEEAGVWKPAPGSYRYALDQCGAAASEAMLVAVHPWDIDGASRAGLTTAWLNRTGGLYPSYFRRPDVEVQTLSQLARALT